MPEISDPAPGATFRPKPGHFPRSKQDRYKRIQYYVGQLGEAASAQMKQALIVLRNAAEQLPPELQPIAHKDYSDTELLPALKELVCIWIHVEAIEQGSESMMTWLMEYFKLALHATDSLIPEPKALDIMTLHAHCEDLESLYTEVSTTIGGYLGFGDQAPTLAPAFVALLINSKPLRQKLFKDSLTIQVEDIEEVI